MKRALAALGALLVLVALAAAQSSGNGYQPAQVISAKEAVYPPNAIGPGTVVLLVTVNAQGEIAAVKVAEGAAGFTSSALQAIKEWKFKPATLDGEPISTVIPVAFSFSQPSVWWPRSP
jgi:TonB family protein